MQNRIVTFESQLTKKGCSEGQVGFNKATLSLIGID